MAEFPNEEGPFKDPFESHVVQDPFVEDHFNPRNQPVGNPQASGGTVWSENLPDSTAVLVLGILSIIGAFCYGIVGLILGIIALALSGRPEKLYRAEPNRYSYTSYSNLKAGKVCGIIGLAISAVVILGVLLVFVVAANSRW